MGTPLSYAAAGAGESLQDQLKQMFLEQLKKQELAQEAQRIKIAQQSADDNSAYRRMSQESLQQAREAAAKAQAQTGALKIAGTLKPGQDVSDQLDSALSAGDLGDTVQRTGRVQTRNISGIAETGPAAPKITGLASSVNAGLAPKKTYLGTADQQKAADDERQLQALINDPNVPENVREFLKIRSAVPGGAVPSELFKPEKQEHSAAYKEWQDAVASGYKGDFTKYQNEDANRKRTAPAMITVQTVDANGKPVTQIVEKKAGATFAKAPGSTMEGRLASAEAVKQTGDDIVAKLSDPKFKAAVGPVMGRYSTLREFLGNPPPEFSELAGQVESFALANMGVHGMRSAQGAEQIKKLLDQHHTPESLIATVNGLNAFSQHFLENNRMGSAAAADITKKAAPANETPEHRVWRVSGGKGPEPK